MHTSSCVLIGKVKRKVDDSLQGSRELHMSITQAYTYMERERVLFKLGKIAITIMMLSQPDLEQMVGRLLTRTGTMRLIICTSCKEGGTAF